MALSSSVGGFFLGIAGMQFGTNGKKDGMGDLDTFAGKFNQICSKSNPKPHVCGGGSCIFFLFSVRTRKCQKKNNSLWGIICHFECFVNKLAHKIG